MKLVTKETKNKKPRLRQPKAKTELQKALRDRVYRQKRYCNINNIIYTLTWVDLERSWTGVCAITGQRLNDEKYAPDSCYIIRLDTTKGFIPGNFLITTRRVASAKSGLSADSIIRLDDFLDGVFELEEFNGNVCPISQNILDWSGEQNKNTACIMFINTKQITVTYQVKRLIETLKPSEIKKLATMIRLSDINLDIPW